MDVGFAEPEIDRRCRTRQDRQRAWGEHAGAIARCLFELSALSSLADVGLLPGRELRELGVPGRYRLRSSFGVELVVTAVASSGNTPAPASSTEAKLLIEEVTVQNYVQEEAI